MRSTNSHENCTIHEALVQVVSCEFVDLSSLSRIRLPKPKTCSIRIQSPVDAALCRRTPKLLVLFDPEPVDQSRNDRFGKAARHALHGRVFFIEKVARV